MKKKSLLLILLMALIAPWAVAQQALPYSYGFEDNDLSIDGWTTQNPSGLNASEFGINKNAKKTGNYGFRFSSYNDSGTSTQYLISPELSAPKGVNVSFYYKSSSTSSSGEKFKVGYSTTNTDVSSFLWSDEYSTSSTSWSQLPEFNCPEGTKYIAIYYYPNYQYRLYIDDISLNVPPSCMKPTGLAATLTPGDGTIATLNWTAGGEETAWVLEYGTTSDFTGATSVNVSGTPTKNLKGLTAETKYYARVKADCGGGDTSEWSATCEFTPTNLLYINILGTTGSTSSYLPSNTNYDYAYTQQIYTAEEMGSFPCTLKSVAFKGNNAAVCDLDIYLANTTKSSFTGTSDYIAINEATLVFRGEVTFIANDWKTITFDNEFDYEGGNLAVIVDDNSGNYDYYTTTWQTFNTTTAQALYFYQDDTNINPSSPSAGYYSTLSLKDKIKFVYELPSPYVKPKNLAVTNLTNSTATITWEAPNSDVQSYKYQYREAGGSWSALTSTTALSAPLTSLTGNTTYEFQVQAIYAGDNESGFASIAFTTLIAIPYAYGFEDESELDCWTVLNPSTDSQYGFGTTGITDEYEDYVRTGDYCFYFVFAEYTAQSLPYQYLISPKLTGIANGLHVEFYYCKYESGSETFKVGYSTTDNDPSSFTWGDEIADATTEYKRFSANYPADVKYVAIQHTSDNQYLLFIDDFKFEEAASCLEPTNVLVDNITTTGATISWTPGATETAWDIFMTKDATIVPDESTTPTYANVTDNTDYPVSCDHSSTYYVYVRAICSENSAWSVPAIFDSECEGMDLPYSYGFEDAVLPVCWNIINTNTSYTGITINTTAANVHDGDKSLDFYRGSSDGTLIAVLPEVKSAYPLSHYEFTFWIKGSNSVEIGIMTDPDDATTFVKQGETISATSEYTQYTVRFNNYTGEGQYIAIKNNSSVSAHTYIDDVAINPLPSCIEPSGLTVSDETAHGATFSWTNGGSETEWHLYVSTENTAPADDIYLKEVYVVDDNPHTITTGLDPETDYYVWVRANCGGGDGYSSWVGPETFTTTIACPAPTGLAVSEITGHTAKLSWNGTSNSYNVRYRTAAGATSTKLFFDGFETYADEDELETVWTVTDLGDGNNTSELGLYSGAAQNDSYGFRFSSYNGSSSGDFDQYLISPELTQTGLLEFAYKSTSGNSDIFRVGYSSTTDDISAFTWGEVTNSASSWKTYSELMPENAKYFAINYIAVYQFRLYIDDITIYATVPAGAWQTVNPAPDSSPCTISDLSAETKYEAQVQGNCGGEGLSQWSSSIFFTTDIACPAPTGLTASNPKSNSFDLQWTNGGSEDWVLAYKVDGAADFTEVDLNVSDVTEEAGTISYTLGGLDAETNYIVKVRDNCEPSYAGDGVSEWTAEVTYSTIPTCSALNPVVSNITHHVATVNWEGESNDGYTVKYRTSASASSESPVFFEEFNNNSSTPPTGWTRYSGLVDAVIAGSTSLTTVTSGWYTNSTHALGSYNAAINIFGSSVNRWLVTPEITLTEGLSLSFDLALTDYGNDNAIEYPEQQPDDRFVVLVFADDAWHILREWNNSGSPYVYNKIATTGEKVVIDLAAYDGKTIKVAFYGESTVAGASSGVDDNDLHIDNVLIGTTIPGGEWQTKAADAAPANITGLEASTMYDVMVVPNCDPTQGSEIICFTTVSADEKWFLGTTDDDWSVAANWEPEVAPTLTQNVILYANVTIPNGCVAEANSITGTGTEPGAFTLTINDGGQLKHNNSGVRATVKKHIVGYGEGNTHTRNGYYLISNPMNTNISTTSTPNYESTGILAGTYDYYSWSNNPSNGLQWKNYEADGSAFSMSYGLYGYLYAHENNADLTFTGNIQKSDGNSNRYLSYTSDPSAFQNWYLLGNPYVCNVYLVNASTSGTGLPYYKMNGDGNGFVAVAAGTPIAPMEGIFYEAESGATVYMVRTAPTPATSNGGNLNIALAQNVNSRDAVAATDNAIVRFDGGQQLSKFSFRENSTKVYIPQNEKEFAIVSAEASGTLPVNLKIAETGSYTISFSADDMEFTYLHLIDRLTGADIDLLIDDSYTFMASVRDQENRFTLVFNAIDSNIDVTSDIFAYQSDDELIVSGEGTLQIFDVMGRFVGSYEVNGTKRISASQFDNAVYIFRLVGETVKTQKIVVR